MPDKQYDVYVQPFLVTEVRDGCTYKTEPQPHGWYPKELVDANKPAQSGIIYAAPNDEFSQENMTIRVRRKNQ